MFEPGTSKATSNCLLPKNNGKNGHIESNKKNQNSSKNQTKRDLIESLVSEAADRLNVDYVLTKTVQGLQNENNKKRKSCSAVLEKSKSSKRQQLSCEARICPREEGSKANPGERPQDVNINDYMVMVNKQLKALQDLPIIQKSSTSEIQDFILNLDESQIENFLKKKADSIRSTVESDPNAKSILAFIQKKVILPVLENRSSVEGVASTNDGNDTSLAGPSTYNCSKKVQEENSKSDAQECVKKKSNKIVSSSVEVEDLSNHGDQTSLADPNRDNCSKNTVEKEKELNGDTREVNVDIECCQEKSDDSAIKSKPIGANLTNEDSHEVTITSILESEIEITSSEVEVIQSDTLDNLNSIDLFKLTRKDLNELIGPLFQSRKQDSNSRPALNLKESSGQEIKTALKENIRNFFSQLISFSDVLRTCTDIIEKKDSEGEVKAKVEKVETSTSLTEEFTEKPLTKTANENLNSHCQCCALKSLKCNSEEIDSTLKAIKQPETKKESSNLSSLKQNTSTSESPEAIPKNTDISSTTALDAETAFPATASSTVATTPECKIAFPATTLSTVVTTPECKIALPATASSTVVTKPECKIALHATASSTVVTKPKYETVIEEDFIKFEDITDDFLLVSDALNGELFKCKKCDYTTKSKLKLKRHVKYAKKNPLIYNHKKKTVKKPAN